MDWYEIVPKDFVENIQFRIRMRAHCEKDAGMRKAMMDLCREDVLFFFNAFCWLHEPRPMQDSEGRLLPEVIPFITWPHQDPIILTIRENLGHKDIGVEKSRGEGMTWIALLLALQDWLFALPGLQRLVVNVASRTVEMADTPDDLNTLMPKLDWQLEMLPGWMVGPKLSTAAGAKASVGYVRRLKDRTLFNVRNKALISIYAGTAELGSGGRCRYWFIDELSKFEPRVDDKALTASQATSHSRLIVGTPYGPENAYAKIMRKPSRMVKLVMRWQDNPTRNRGLYRLVRGVPVALDPASNPLPPHYDPPSNEVQALFIRLRKAGFRLDKGVRSPWYDNECDAPNATPYSIAQELDRDYGGSLNQIFTESFFEAARKTVRAPFCCVDVMYDRELQPSITVADDGALALWMTLDAKNRPPEHAYILGVDLSSGLGGEFTSNSVIQIIDAVTMEQVGELASNLIEPAEFADLSVAICKWVGNAYLAWERNPPGGGYTSRIRQIRYPNIYLQSDVFNKRQRKKTKRPGWWTDPKTKEVLFSDMQRLIATKQLKLRSRHAMEECAQYIRVGRAIEHVVTIRTRQDAKEDTTHGDRVMALGVGVQALLDRQVKPFGGPAAPEPIEPGSIEERDKEWAEMQASRDDWDPRSNWDLGMGRSVGESVY